MLTQDEHRALKHLAKGEYDEAIKIYEDLLKEGEDPDLYNTLGDVYLRKGETEQAIKRYEKALFLYEKDSLYENAIAVGKKILRYGERKDILLALARLNSIIERNDEAIEYLTRLLNQKIQPEELESINELLKKIGESISKDSDIQPRFERLFYKFQDIVEKIGKMNLEGGEEEPKENLVNGRGLESLLDFEKTLTFEDEGVEELLKEEELKIEEGENTIPEAELLEGLNLEGTSEPRTVLQKFEEEIEEKTEEIESAEEEEIVIPEGIPLEESLEEEIPGEVIGEILKTVEKGKWAEPAINPLIAGEELLRMRLHFPAVQLLQRAAQNPSDRQRAQLLLGKAFFEMGEFELARRVLRRILNEDMPSSSQLKEILYFLGRVEESLGNLDKAEEYYEEVLSIDYQFKDAKERLEKIKKEFG